MRDWRVLQTSPMFQYLQADLSDIFIRLYALDPDNYAENERHVKHEFEKLAASATSAAERMQEMQKAISSLTRAIEDLEAQQVSLRHNFVIEEEPDTEELLS